MIALLVYLSSALLVFLLRKDLGGLWSKITFATATFLFLAWGLNPPASATFLSLYATITGTILLIHITSTEKAYAAFWRPLQHIMVAPGRTKALVGALILIPMAVGFQSFRSSVPDNTAPDSSSNTHILPILTDLGLDEVGSAHGLDVAPLPAQLDLVKKDARWPLTELMIERESSRSLEDSKISAGFVDTLPADGSSSEWASLSSSRLTAVATSASLSSDSESETAEFTVKAAYTDSEVALLIQWPTSSDSSGKTLKAAVQFPSDAESEVPPHFLLGDASNGVNTWGWDAENDSLTEGNANGLSRQKTQDEGNQALKGSVSQADGRYSMYVRRALQTEDAKDAQFAAGAFKPIAINLWTASDAEPLHSVTGWYWLHLEAEVEQSAYVRPPFFFLFTLLLLGFVVKSNRASAESGDLGVLPDIPSTKGAALLTHLYKGQDQEDYEKAVEAHEHHDDHHHENLHWSQWPDDEQMGHATQGKIGMWLFLLSDCFSFSGLLLTYGVLRAGVDVWHCTPEVLAAGIECGPIEPEFGLEFTASLTFILICSSVSMVLAIGACMENKRKEMLFWLGTTIFFGAFFLLGQYKEYWGLPTLGHMIEPMHLGFGEWLHHGLTDEGVNWGESHRATTFYLITGFHGAHVTTGVLLLCLTFVKAYRGDFDNGDYNFMEIIGLFWHFVDLVWIIVFTVVYLIPANPGIH